MAADRYERRHRRTARNVNCVEVMANADFGAVPSLSEAMGLEEPAPMTAANKPTRRLAEVIAVAVEIRCPCCDREDPIPARDGSFMWDRIPETVTCPDCGATSRVSRRITPG